MKIKQAGHDQRGFALPFFIVLLAVIMVVGSLIADIAQLYAIKIATRHMLNLSLRAAVAELDMEELKNNRIVIDESAATNKFYEVLRTNFKLDAYNRPMPGSIVDGPVDICYFQIINEDMVPFTYTFGDYSESILCPAATGIIKFPVKQSFWSKAINPELSETDMYVHSTVTPELISKHL